MGMLPQFKHHSLPPGAHALSACLLSQRPMGTAASATTADNHVLGVAKIVRCVAEYADESPFERDDVRLTVWCVRQRCPARCCVASLIACACRLRPSDVIVFVEVVCMRAVVPLSQRVPRDGSLRGTRTHKGRRWRPLRWWRCWRRCQQQRRVGRPV